MVVPTLLSAFLVWVVLVGVGVERDVRVLVLALMLAALVFGLVLDYGRRSDFWRSVSRAVGDAADDALAVSDLVEEPGFVEGKVCWQALDAVSREGYARATSAMREASEYREYIEAWVHEAKTPIAAARLIVDNNPGKVSSDISRELIRIDGYVEQALFYARSATVDRDYSIREVMLRDIVSDALRAHARTLIDAGMSVEREGLDVPVFADPKWVAFILGQLFENAAKYRAPEGSSRTPSLRLLASRDSVGEARELVLLRVEDNGLGIEPQDLPRVFDKGFVGKNGRLGGQSKSTGLGLFLTRRLCGKMGLGVSIESEPGSWTRVTLAFPADRSHYVDYLD